MAFAEQLGQLLADKSHEEQFSGAVLVKRNEGELFKAAKEHLLDNARGRRRWWSDFDR